MEWCAKSRASRVVERVPFGVAGGALWTPFGSVWGAFWGMFFASLFVAGSRVVKGGFLMHVWSSGGGVWGLPAAFCVSFLCVWGSFSVCVSRSGSALLSIGS